LPSLFTGHVPVLEGSGKFSQIPPLGSPNGRGRGGNQVKASLTEAWGAFSNPARAVEDAPRINAKFAHQVTRSSNPHHRIYSSLSLETRSKQRAHWESPSN